MYMYIVSYMYIYIIDDNIKYLHINSHDFNGVILKYIFYFKLTSITFVNYIHVELTLSLFNSCYYCNRKCK